MIEHRYSLRRPIEAEVVLNFRALGLVRGKVRDLGVGGMFVDLGCVQLPLNALVEVSLLLDCRATGEAIRAEAMVVHQAGGGVGLMFRDLDPQCHMFLHDMVYIGDIFPVQRVNRRAMA
ncbi:MAG: hypothetical protein C0631_06055 [Sedimenticola sp.]|nr:MAG: hypothetical protein C0631_06055 [Sedimenticola sp.]